MVEDLKEKTWELDTNTRNNLVFYGMKEDGATGNSEWAVRELIKNQLHISRELNITKCHRQQQPDTRGVRPLVVTFHEHAVSGGRECDCNIASNLGQECRPSEGQHLGRHGNFD